jgi:hypothetical protein
LIRAIVILGLIVALGSRSDADRRALASGRRSVGAIDTIRIIEASFSRFPGGIARLRRYELNAGVSAARTIDTARITEASFSPTRCDVELGLFA